MIKYVVVNILKTLNILTTKYCGIYKIKFYVKILPNSTNYQKNILILFILIFHFKMLLLIYTYTFSCFILIRGNSVLMLFHNNNIPY